MCEQKCQPVRSCGGGCCFQSRCFVTGVIESALSVTYSGEWGSSTGVVFSWCSCPRSVFTSWRSCSWVARTEKTRRWIAVFETKRNHFLSSVCFIKVFPPTLNKWSLSFEQLLTKSRYWSTKICKNNNSRQVLICPSLESPSTRQNPETKLQNPLRTSLNGRRKVVFWHDLIHISFSAHRSNEKRASTAGELIETPEPDRHQIAATINNQRFVAPIIHQNLEGTRYLTIVPKKHILSQWKKDYQTAEKCKHDWSTRFN